MNHLNSGRHKPYERSPLLIAAYCTLGGALLMLLVGSGVLWILAGVAMAVSLAAADLLLKLRRK